LSSPRVSPGPIEQVWRFLQIGVVNTLFGYTLYALLVAIGLQMFVAQVVATVIAVAFNYVMYSRFVFNGAPAPKLRFLLSYAVNYLISLAALALAAKAVASPYFAGLMAALVATTINFVVLRRFVFIAHPAPYAASAMPVLQPATVSE